MSHEDQGRMTRVWLVTCPDWDSDNIQGVYASMDAVRTAFPTPLVWVDISSEYGQEWKAELPPDDGHPWDVEYRAELLTVIE